MWKIFLGNNIEADPVGIYPTFGRPFPLTRLPVGIFPTFGRPFPLTRLPVAFPVAFPLPCRGGAGVGSVLFSQRICYLLIVLRK